MAKTAAEYQRAYRERKKEQERMTPDPTDVISRRKFYEYVAENFDSFQSEVYYPLEWAGINPDCLPTFEADDDPEYDPDTDGPYRGSIGRAERMASLLMSAGRALAYSVNFYKREEIERAIAELENADLSDPAAKRQALAEIVRLTKLHDRLDKQVRWTLPQWELRGG